MAAVQARYEAKQAASPWARLERSQRRIKALERQVRALGGTP